ncbi:MAG: polysaccharide biosynthesis protein PslH [Thermoanaerobaculia bacterium]|jgi:glycosyltransferase involved in cell wall biosynthesis|nr:polysaccharide biosynthesis protein PslH [Thermoanaerobaculia bacterium]
MTVLVISSRFPWPSHTGDRMRASIWLSALAPHGHVALVAPPGEIPAGAGAFDFYPAARSFTRGVRGATVVLRRGLPLQSLLAAPYDWPAAIASAQHDLGAFDTTIVILARADPWVRASLGGGMKILDAIDSLRRNAAERGNAASPVTRWFWRREERRLARVEADLPRAYDRIVVVSGEEASEFGSSAAVIENSVCIRPLDLDAPRPFDFGFWGRLGYFANADAAMWLVDEIWPAILARNSSATCVIAGADAPRSMRRAAKRRGIALISPVDDMATLARSVRVAILPVRYGSGQSSKVLEAGEAGCAIVATRPVMRGLEPLTPHVRIANDVSSIADTATELLASDTRKATAALRRIISANHSRDRILEQLASIAGVRDADEAVTA